MILKPNTRLTLNNGVEIPILGLGVFRTVAGEETRRTVQAALELGYRHIDTAHIYRNEADVGFAIKNSNVARQDVFVTTKLWNADQGYDPTLRAFDTSLKTLGLDYIDLYLVHWPVPELRRDTWRAMSQLMQGGQCRAIGVSNYMLHHLQETLEDGGIVPAVNQIEVSPFLYPEDLIAYCRENKIVVEAYSPLTKGQKLNDPRLQSIALRHGKSVAQVLIRWCLQHELVVLPKTVRRERLIENATVFDFELTPDDMALLDGLNENLHTGWDPTRIA